MLSASALKAAARESGFTLVGLARAEPLDPTPLRRWLDQGMAASMSWMHEKVERRLDPAKLFAGARTVVALGCCLRTREHTHPSPIALYARGRDYHATLRDRLRALRRRVEALSPGIDSYAEVDTGPVMERAWAERAGLGWIGKNGMLLTREHGSHVMLAVMLLNQEADAYDERQPERCGGCGICRSACPTGAIVEPGVIDSRLCLSHQTIEDRGVYADGLRPHAHGLGFGCDLCQRQCPWNRPDHACDDPRFAPRPIAELSLVELASLTRERFTELTRGTAVARATYDGLRRNALVALGAQAHPDTAAVALPLIDDPSEPVRLAARWALTQVER
jgi:epoxyqueuosine reductase